MAAPSAVKSAALAAAILAIAACDESRKIQGQQGQAPGAIAECTRCHGSEQSLAPPPSASGATATTDVAVGAHQAHVRDSAIAKAIACSECHHVPSRMDEPGHLDGSRPKVQFGPIASTGGKGPAWDRATATCSNVYCHGATVQGGADRSPVWTRVDGSQARCGSCHGAPPPPPHPARTDCFTCHPGTVKRDGTVDVAGGLHLNGRLDVAVGGGACGSCHTIPPAPPHPASSACGTCHEGYTPASVNAALHLNGKVDVRADLACGSCHAIPPPAPHVQSTDCGKCHPGYTSTSVNAATHWNGKVDVADLACGACHSIPPPPPHVQSTGCGTCHVGYTSTSVNASTHRNGKVDVADGAACGTCHTIPPPPPHPQTQQCGACHVGYTSSSVVAATHRNGRVDVQAPTCGACHAIPPASGRHGEHVEHGVSCGSCHAGASTTSGGNDHMNGVVNVTAPGWNGTSRSCANACHDQKRWDGSGGD